MKIALADSDAEIEPVPTDAHGHKAEPELDRLSNILKTFNNRFGTPEENPAFWNSISANSYLSEIAGPIQLHHGTADTDVPVQFSENLFYQMLAAAQYVELYKYDGDNHNISNYFSTAMQRTIEFFDRYVK